MLYDKDFLLKLDKEQHKVIYARITALTFQETPIEYIEGRVTQGSINLDGASAVRRSCSLTIIAQDFDYSNYYWGLNTKFKLEIGVENTIDSTYPNIIWFKQGTYLITSFNTSRNTSSFNITIQGKDKMCLLNGEVGGTIESSVDFGTIEEEDQYGNWTMRKIPIPEIIRNIVHVYGGEPYHNIIINDLDMYGLELLEYRLDTPLYLYRKLNNLTYENAVLGGDKLVDIYTVIQDETSGEFKLGTLQKSSVALNTLQAEDLEILVDQLTATTIPRAITEPNQTEDGFFVTKVEYGQTAGYRYTDLVYAGDLIANVGESVVSVLDKIKTMLTEFEYFYNLEGQFVFQKKQSFKETIWSNDKDAISQSLQQGLAVSSSYAYEFHSGELITAFNNNPNLLNLKNDYSIWGERESVSGAKIPIHLRYAIDKKPERYTNIRVTKEEVQKYNKQYNTSLKPQGDYSGGVDIPSNPIMTYVAGEKFSKKEDIITCDWREIIYQMAQDYYRYNFLDDFELRVAEANPIDYPSGRTGYEEYYIDIQGFWRELYYPGLDGEVNELKDKKDDLEEEVSVLQKSLYGTEVSWSETTIGGVENDLTALNNYHRDNSILGGFESVDTMKEYYKTTYKFVDDKEVLITDLKIIEGMLSEKYFKEKSQLATYQLELDTVLQKYNYQKEQCDNNYYPISHDYYCWNRNVYEAPDQLNFWFDFLDTQGELQQFSVRAIGARSKAINDTNIKSIYFRETPSVVFGNESLEGYRTISLGVLDADTLFTCSARGKNAKNKLDELLYEHGYCIESATITTIPIYYLEPNTRIYLHDEETGLDGDYIVSKITIPLTYNGTMSLTATKAAENVI